MGNAEYMGIRVLHIGRRRYDFMLNIIISLLYYVSVICISR